MRRLLLALALLGLLALLLPTVRRGRSEAALSPRVSPLPSEAGILAALPPADTSSAPPSHREPAPTTPDPMPRAGTVVHVDHLVRVSRDGLPLSGVEIGTGRGDELAPHWFGFLSDPPASQVQTTDALGQARFLGLPETWTAFWVHVPGLEPVRFSDRPHAAQTFARSVPLGSAALVGRVRDPEGEPQPGAALLLLQVGVPGEAALWFGTTADDEGRYAIEGLAGGPERRVLLYPEALTFGQLESVVLASGERRLLDVQTLFSSRHLEDDDEPEPDR